MEINRKDAGHKEKKNKFFPGLVNSPLTHLRFLLKGTTEKSLQMGKWDARIDV